MGHRSEVEDAEQQAGDSELEEDDAELQENDAGLWALDMRNDLAYFEVGGSEAKAFG